MSRAERKDMSKKTLARYLANLVNLVNGRDLWQYKSRNHLGSQ